MENIGKNNYLLYFIFLFKIINFPFFLFLITIQIKKSILEYFDSFNFQILSESSSLIDITDYHNIYPLITTSKNIYTGIPPELKKTTNLNIMNISAAVTWNEKIILIACTKDNLLSKINIETGEEKDLLQYDEKGIPKCICTISTINNIAYIGISHVITPDSSDIDSQYLEHTIFRVILNTNSNNDISSISPNSNKDYILEYKEQNFNKLLSLRPFSCEVIGENESSNNLICGYIRLNETSKDKFSYLLNVTLISSNFTGVADEKTVDTFSKLPYIRLQRTGPTNIIYFITDYSYDISLQDGEIYISNKTEQFHKFYSTNGLFFYNNEYLFSSNQHSMYIKKRDSDHYIQVMDTNINDNDIKFQKLLGYYKEDGDKFLLIYEYTSNNIKYVFFENMSSLYSFKVHEEIIQRISNTESQYNVSQLIDDPIDHQLLSMQSLSYYISTTNHSDKYDNYYFNKSTQMLTVYGSLNDWIGFNFFFIGETNKDTTKISAYLVLSKAKVTVKTCLFKCGKCFEKFDECALGDCKNNFTLFEDATEKGCYPNDQNFPNYIYNKTKDRFRKCYQNCEFCSLENEFSTGISQNCKVCKEGYFRSYKFPGNCYQIEYPKNLSNYTKIVDNINDNSFRIIDSCLDLNKYKINDTGECIDTCPNNTQYYTFFYNSSLNFSKQEASSLGLLYPLESEKPPKFLFNKICYSNCPKLTYGDKDLNKCKCKYSWHKNLTTNDDICYDGKDYCLSLDYYYHTDDKECVLNGCKNGYYQMNFECYKDRCPNDTILISSDENKCESTLNYCYIDEYYKTHCSNNFNDEYNLKYDNTNIYFKSCNQSMYYFNQKTYLYINTCYFQCPEEATKIFKDTCYTECPENTKPKDDDDSLCICSYYFHIDDNNNIDCFNIDEICEDKGYSYFNNETKECFTEEECINRGYKIFNNECYENCPKNTEVKVDDNTCICSSYSLHEEDANSILKCFESEIDCAKQDLYFDKTINKCFSSDAICFNTNKKLYFKECLDDCPMFSIINEENPHICECEDFAEEDIDNDTGLQICISNYPELFYTDRKSCPFIYQKQCQLQCPQNTCLTTRINELVQCVDYKQDMTIYNEICIEGIKEYVKMLENITSDDDIIPIITNSGVVLNAFSSDAPLEKLMEKYPNFTFVDLGECKDKIIEANNLPPNIKLYIIGIDTPNLYGNSSINVFNFEIYLKNGTQIDDLKPCDRIQILLSSKINDLEIIRFYKAIKFNEDRNYDIYNRTDPFYIDRCSPVSDEGNDIILSDRLKYYYPNVSICNDGCVYQNVDFYRQRFVCNCNANLTEKVYKFSDGKFFEVIDENDETFSEYFLSLINYKIFLCYKLFFEFKNFYSNAGFYISFITLMVCLILFFIFWIRGVNEIRIIMYQNIPTKAKLIEIIKHQKEKNKNKNIYNTENDINCNNNINNIDFKDIKNPNINISKKVILLNNNNEYNNSNNNSNNNTNNTNINNINTIKTPNRNFDLPKKSLFLEQINFGNHGEKEVEIFNIYRNDKKYFLKKSKYNQFNQLLSPKKWINKARKSHIPFSSKDNLLKCNINKNINKQRIQNTKNNIKDEKKDNIIVFNMNKKNNNDKKDKINNKNPEENDSKELLNSIKVERNQHKSCTHLINRNNIHLDMNGKNIFENDSSNLSQIRAKIVEDLELRIDFNFEHLIDRNDDEIENRELNNIPYRQALRIDKRSFFQIFISVITNEINLLNLYFYRNPYTHYSLSVSIYLFELLCDLTMNCFLYTDDVVSEKYHNNGQLSMITSFSLSILSNMISSILIYVIRKLTNYCEIIEEIIKNVKYKRKYFENILRLFKYMKLRLGTFYFLQFSAMLVMTYYLFIFCVIYNKSQGSVIINYIIGACTSLAISIGLTIIITVLRTISIKYRSVMLFNVSKYLYEHF